MCSGWCFGFLVLLFVLFCLHWCVAILFAFGTILFRGWSGTLRFVIVLMLILFSVDYITVYSVDVWWVSIWLCLAACVLVCFFVEGCAALLLHLCGCGGKWLSSWVCVVSGLFTLVVGVNCLGTCCCGFVVGEVCFMVFADKVWPLGVWFLELWVGLIEVVCMDVCGLFYVLVVEH